MNQMHPFQFKMQFEFGVDVARKRIGQPDCIVPVVFVYGREVDDSQKVIGKGVENWGSSACPFM